MAAAAATDEEEEAVESCSSSSGSGRRAVSSPSASRRHRRPKLPQAGDQRQSAASKMPTEAGQPPSPGLGSVGGQQQQVTVTMSRADGEHQFRARQFDSEPGTRVGARAGAGEGHRLGQLRARVSVASGRANVAADMSALGRQQQQHHQQQQRSRRRRRRRQPRDTRSDQFAEHENKEEEEEEEKEARTTECTTASGRLISSATISSSSFTCGQDARPREVTTRKPTRLRRRRPSSSRAPLSMWPSWRQLVLLACATALATSLLASLAGHLGASDGGSRCALFSQCNALRVEGPADSPVVQRAAPGGGSQNGAPKVDQAPTLEASLQRQQSEVTTTPTTATLGAPTTQSAGQQQQQPAPTLATLAYQQQQKNRKPKLVGANPNNSSASNQSSSISGGGYSISSMAAGELAAPHAGPSQSGRRLLQQTTTPPTSGADQSSKVAVNDMASSPSNTANSDLNRQQQQQQQMTTASGSFAPERQASSAKTTTTTATKKTSNNTGGKRLWEPEPQVNSGGANEIVLGRRPTKQDEPLVMAAAAAAASSRPLPTSPIAPTSGESPGATIAQHHRQQQQQKPVPIKATAAAREAASAAEANTKPQAQMSSAGMKLIESPALAPQLPPPQAQPAPGSPRRHKVIVLAGQRRQQQQSDSNSSSNSTGWTFEPANESGPPPPASVVPQAAPTLQQEHHHDHHHRHHQGHNSPRPAGRSEVDSFGGHPGDSAALLSEAALHLSDLMASAAAGPAYAAPTQDQAAPEGDQGRRQSLARHQIADLRAQFGPPEGLHSRQQLLASVASASAPSVSLPPLSHLLKPRNPFRLFASSSAPHIATTRYFAMPTLIGGGGGHGKTTAAGQQQASGQQQQQRPPPSLSIGRWLASSSSASQSKPAVPPPQAPTVNNYNNYQPQPQFMVSASQLHQLDPASLADLATTTSVYAHSHSAEQLERLVRAASQAGHLPAPPILPALVSGPGGRTYPGFYIPALEPPPGPAMQGSHQSSQMSSPAQESQVNEMRASSAAAGAAEQAAGLMSRIPGTDYILHPDEVRAMMNIGELAWQRQRQAGSESEAAQSPVATGQSQANNNNQQQQQQQTSASNTVNHNVRRPPHDHWPQVRPMVTSFHQASTNGNLMRENHAENARNYAYVETGPQLASLGPPPPPPPHRDDHLQGSQSAPSQQRYYQQSNGSTSAGGQEAQPSGLGGQVARQMLGAKNFPAIIRINDQDYVHWPLIRVGGGGGGAAGSSGGQTDATASGPPGRQPQLVGRDSMAAASATRVQPGAPPTGPAEGGSPVVRLATQLTPSEIRQVEDSILETLIMAQTMQHKQRIMQAMAAANNIGRPPPAMGALGPPRAWPTNSSPAGRQVDGANMNPNSNSNSKSNSNSNQSRFRPGFFGRRRRRNSNQKQQQQQQPPTKSNLGALSSRQHFMSMLPVLGVGEPTSTSNFRGAELPADYQQQQRALLLHPPGATYRDQLAAEPLEPLEIESKLSQRLPVVMADQETNKPDQSAGRLELMGASSASILVANTPTTGGRVGHETSRSGRQLQLGAGFGDRVQRKKSQTVPNKSAAHDSELDSSGELLLLDHQRPSSLAPDDDKKSGRTQTTDETSTTTTSSGKTPGNNQHHQAKQQYSVAFVPIRDNRSRQISLYHGGLDGTAVDYTPKSSPVTTATTTNTNQKQIDSLNVVDQQLRGSETSQSRPNRINVDWPAMVSDADYFPPKPAQHHQPGSLHQKHQRTSSRGEAEDVVSSSASASSPSARNKKQLIDGYDDNDGDDGDDSLQSSPSLADKHRGKKKIVTATTIQRPTTRRGNYVTSQMKLQFAQDYQAREGVPIYNNNVRVAGALDKRLQADTAATSRSNSRQKSLPNTQIDDPADGFNDSEDKDDFL